jgi:Zn-dependent metalloprotease
MYSQKLQHPHVCGVIPPHILRHIEEYRGPVDADVRNGASDTLAHMAMVAARRDKALEEQLPSAEGKYRQVYDAQHQQKLPGKLVMTEHLSPRADVEVNEAFDGAGKTYDFYSEVFSRNSIDNRGLRIDSTIHYGRHFENAFWNGAQMVYGDGDGKYFNRFTAALDVIGHELAHGVTQYTANLGYTGETGALNEHVSDAFGIMVKQWSLGQQARRADWIIGEGLFGPMVNGKGLRSMAAPGTAYDDPVLGRDPQPAHLRDYVVTTDDNGGVHINSGIPNHAFYRAAVAIGGSTWNVLGRIWYVSLSYIKSKAGFQEFADVTCAVAGALYGKDAAVQNSVRRAWIGVGLTPVDRRATQIAQPSPASCKHRRKRRIARPHRDRLWNKRSH